MNTWILGFLQTVCLKARAYAAMVTGQAAGYRSGWQHHERRVRPQEGRAGKAPGRQNRQVGSERLGDPVEDQVSAANNDEMKGNTPRPGLPAFSTLSHSPGYPGDGFCCRRRNAGAGSENGPSQYQIDQGLHAHRSHVHGHDDGDRLQHDGQAKQQIRVDAARGYAPIVIYRRKPE
jgi:hypothetical protein